MTTLATVLSRARSATGHTTLYWIGQGGADPGAPMPSNPVHVARSWAGLDAASQAALAPLAQALAIDVHDPDLVRDACDCSGFVCWALGFARHRPGTDGSKEWTNTDSIWQDATGPQQRFQRLADARPGCLVVYPQRDSNERYGHVAIVIAADAAGTATAIAHCAADNIASKPYDAIKITSTEQFLRQPLSIYCWCRDVD